MSDPIWNSPAGIATKLIPVLLVDKRACSVASVSPLGLDSTAIQDLVGESAGFLVLRFDKPTADVFQFWEPGRLAHATAAGSPRHAHRVRPMHLVLGRGTPEHFHERIWDKVEGLGEASFREVGMVLGNSCLDHFAKKVFAERTGPAEREQGRFAPPTLGGYAGQLPGKPSRAACSAARYSWKLRCKKPQRPSPSMARIPASSRIRSRNAMPSRPSPVLGDT